MSTLPARAVWWIAGGDLDECGRGLVEVCVRSALRTYSNHLVPALTFLVAAAGMVELLLPGLKGADSLTMGHAMARVFLFDYGIFLASWVSGWNMSRRWRSNVEMVEEVALAPLPPRHVGLALVSGNVAAWGLMVLALMAFELVLCGVLFMVSANMDYVAVALSAPFAAVFHMETARLGHAMYSHGALPRTKLHRLAVRNFILIAVLVLGLSAFGSMMTAMAATIAAVATLDPGEHMGQMWPWSIGSVPAYVVVLWLKRLNASWHLRNFERLWLMFQWWGAAELEQPEDYRRSFENAAERWMAYHRALEELAVRGDGKPGPFTKRYRRLVNMAGASGTAGAPPVVNPVYRAGPVESPYGPPSPQPAAPQSGPEPPVWQPPR